MSHQFSFWNVVTFNYNSQIIRSDKLIILNINRHIMSNSNIHDQTKANDIVYWFVLIKFTTFTERILSIVHV